MLFITHLFSGILIYILLLITLPLHFTISGITAFLLGVLSPDLDHPKSKISKKVKPLAWLIHKTLGHRGLVHTFLGAMLFSIAFAYILQFINLPQELAFWFFAGFLAHLLGDSLTPQGIKWLYPFSKRRFRSFIRTGSFLETIFLALVLSTLMYLGWHWFI